MNKKTLPQAVHIAECGDQPQPKPWQRHGRRGARVTIIVIELLRIKTGTLIWGDPMESALALAIALLAFEMVCGTARTIALKAAKLLPKRIELTRPNGRPRFSFGW
ncbi:hypothetical protein [Streptomyces lavendulae]